MVAFIGCGKNQKKGVLYENTRNDQQDKALPLITFGLPAATEVCRFLAIFDLPRYPQEVCKPMLWFLESTTLNRSLQKVFRQFH